MTTQHERPKGARRHEQLPVFEHADQVYGLIGALYQRPRFGDRPRTLNSDFTWGGPADRDRRSPKQGLPMLCLIRSGEPADLLVRIGEFLDRARNTGGGLRHKRLDLAAKPESSESRELETGTAHERSLAYTQADVLRVRELLRQARNGLVKNPKARDRILHFPRFSLVNQLMAESSDPDDPRPDETSTRILLREHSGMRRIERAVRNVDKELPEGAGRLRIPLWLAYLLSVGVYRITVTGRVPLISGRYRWFMRQPHLAPELSGSFVRFAERLVAWRQEAPEYVARLLVNSFLEDLRREYRLRPWQLLRRRRMTYPMLLLDNIDADNGGHLLLRLINDVRNQLGSFDPLLVIATSATVPLEASAGDQDGPAVEAHDGYRGWQNTLQQERLARGKSTWYLPIGISKPATASKRASDKVKAFGGFDAGRAAGRPALIASRWLRLSVVFAVLGSLSGFGVYTWHSQCDSIYSSLQRTSWTGGECLGITDGRYNLFRSTQEDDTTQAVVDKILSQDKEAADDHAAFPQRPYITIADLEATSTDGTAESLTTEREGLEGVAVAQRRALDAQGDADPIVRVLLANGGKGMLHGPDVAAQLSRLKAHDPSFVGVVGLDNSSTQTLNTISALGDAGLPVVAAPLSEDHLPLNHPLYFQIAPQNTSEAAVAAAFANQLVTGDSALTRSIRIYYSDDANDIYSKNLRDDLVSAVTGRDTPGGKFHEQAIAFTPKDLTDQEAKNSTHAQEGDELIGDAGSAGLNTCGYHGIVFYAGRGVPDYGDFLRGAAQCQSPAVFLADDDVSRYVADANARQQTLASTYYYMSFAVAPVVNPQQATQQDFYATLTRLFSFEGRANTSRSLDGHAALSYDATNVLITATRYLRSNGQNIPVNPSAVWREITDIHGPQATFADPHARINGVSGSIDYGGDITRQVPLNKPTAILQVQEGNVNPTISGFCGSAVGFTPSRWCPVDK